jgi:hypothetical protein
MNDVSSAAAIPQQAKNNRNTNIMAQLLGIAPFLPARTHGFCYKTRKGRDVKKKV